MSPAVFPRSRVSEDRPEELEPHSFHSQATAQPRPRLLQPFLFPKAVGLYALHRLCDTPCGAGGGSRVSHEMIPNAQV